MQGFNIPEFDVNMGATSSSNGGRTIHNLDVNDIPLEALSELGSTVRQEEHQDTVDIPNVCRYV